MGKYIIYSVAGGLILVVGLVHAHMAGVFDRKKIDTTTSCEVTVEEPVEYEASKEVELIVEPVEDETVKDTELNDAQIKEYAEIGDTLDIGISSKEHAEEEIHMEADEDDTIYLTAQSNTTHQTQLPDTKPYKETAQEDTANEVAGDADVPVAATVTADRVWVEPVYDQVWVVDREKQIVELPIYETKGRAICHGCGKDITANAYEHTSDPNNDICTGFKTESYEVIVGYNTIVEPEEGHWETVLVEEGHWVEASEYER